jgi:glutamate carboxypeptidase
MMASQKTEEKFKETINEIRDILAKRRDEILSKTRAIVEIESPSKDIEGNHAVVSLLEKEARKNPAIYSIEKIDAKDYGQHLIIRAFKQEQNDGVIFLLGHTDTVHPRGTLEQRPYRIEGEKIYGPGIFDMKANCVLLLEVLKVLVELNLKPNKEIVILLSCDEEMGSPTGREFVEREARNAIACFVLEPSASGGRVKTGRKGTGMFTMHAKGIPAHAGLDYEKGASAILELARQTERLHSLTNLEAGTTINVGVFHGGTTSNVFAEDAEIDIDVRFSRMDEAARIENEILSSQPFDERVKLTIEGAINRPPMERDENVVALYEKAKTIGTSFGYEIGEAQVGGASDGNFVAALGVPVLDGLGIEGDGAHAVHEHIVYMDIPNRGALIAGMILSL